MARPHRHPPAGDGHLPQGRVVATVAHLQHGQHPVEAAAQQIPQHIDRMRVSVALREREADRLLARLR